MKTILLTFDVEEFDLPREFGISLKEKEFEISKTGLLSILDLLSKYNLKATFFTTAEFAKKYPSLIKQLSENHEIACHSYCHSEICSLKRIKQAKQEIEKITGKEIKGFRAPRFEIKPAQLSELDFFYDSSIHPTFMPGRYMNLHKKRTIHKIKNIIEIPPSVLPIIRIPVSWLTFKNFPKFYPKLFTKINFLSSDYTMTLLHPWEFTDLSKIKIPKYIKKRHSKELLNQLEDYIKFCKKNKYQFNTISNYLEKSLI